jgi:hypothetical protein
MTTRPVTQSASFNLSSRLRARLGLQVKRMLAGRAARAEAIGCASRSLIKRSMKP